MGLYSHWHDLSGLRLRVRRRFGPVLRHLSLTAAWYPPGRREFARPLLPVRLAGGLLAAWWTDGVVKGVLGTNSRHLQG